MSVRQDARAHARRSACAIFFPSFFLKFRLHSRRITLPEEPRGSRARPRKETRGSEHLGRPSPSGSVPKDGERSVGSVSRGVTSLSFRNSLESARMCVCARARARPRRKASLEEFAARTLVSQCLNARNALFLFSSKHCPGGHRREVEPR